MKRMIPALLFLICFSLVSAQNISTRLTNAFEQFERDTQLKNAIASLYVMDAKTGSVVYEKNATIGMAPASTQKVITAATAYEVLGKDFRYKTEFGYDGTIEKGVLKGNVYLVGSGDPTLGSWRWRETRDTMLLRKWVQSMQAAGIKGIEGNLVMDDSRFESQGTPDGWIWQDLGNYYGAGCWGLNWKENQFDIRLASGTRVGDSVKIVHFDISNDYPIQLVLVRNELKSAAKGTGDNAYVYAAPNTIPATFYLRGTIPVNEKNFSISASMPYPPYILLMDLVKRLILLYFRPSFPWFITSDVRGGSTKASNKMTVLFTHISPSLDSIIYWFNRRSINLYGEALLKTIAFQKRGIGSTEKGTEEVKKFWKERDIAPTELNIVDGSGLSPQNRITTRAQVAILQYAQKQSWFNGFYLSLPEYNGMKMKSGTIRNVKAFCGYHTAKNGAAYIFSFLVNNYNGSSAALVQKMYQVLDVLK